jgi:hypothetical protein
LNAFFFVLMAITENSKLLVEKNIKLNSTISSVH